MKPLCRFIGGLFLITGIPVVITFLLILPAHREFTSLSRQIEKYEQELSMQKASLLKIPSLRLANRTLRVGLNQKMSKFVLRDSLNAFVNQIAALSRRHDLRLTNVHIITDSIARYGHHPLSGTLSTETPFLYEWEGRYLDYGRFIEALKQQPYAVYISDFMIRSHDNTQRLTIQARASVRITW